jgi:hypothetical protein
MCVQLKKPYATIDCTYDDFVAQNADAVIIRYDQCRGFIPCGSYPWIIGIVE